MGKKDNLFKDWMLFIVYIALWVALIAGFFMDGFDGLKTSLFSLLILNTWHFRHTAEKELVDIIIKNTDFNLENIENCLFNSSEEVIQDLNEIINDPKNEFRKSRMEDMRTRYIYSIPVTYEVNLHIKPNYKNLFDAYHRNPRWNYPYPKIENNDHFIYGRLEDNDKGYKEKPNPKISIVSNFNNDLVQCFINGKYSKYENFYIDFKKDNHMEEDARNRVTIEIDKEKIRLDLFDNFFDDYHSELYNTYKFPFKLIVDEFKKIFFLFNRGVEGEENFIPHSYFYEYNKYMVKNFSDYTKEKLSFYGLKYDTDETLECYNWDHYEFYEDKLPNTKLSDLKILKLNRNVIHWIKPNESPELFNISVKRHVFTHEFYTAYCDVGIYLNK
jgi:hypothetical protein